MKFTITINDMSLADLQALINAVSNGERAGPAPTISVNQAPPPMPSAAPSDDEAGDVVATAGAHDAEGLPHDARIHSEPAKLTNKGVWRKRRGVSDDLVKQVEAELRKGQPIPQATAAAMITPPSVNVPMPQPQPVPINPAMFAPPPMPPAAPAMPPMHVQPPYAPPPMPEPQPQPTPPAPAPAMDFQGFMQNLTQRMQQRDNTGKPLIDADYLGTVTSRISAAYGRPLNAITDISNYPDMIGYTIQVMQADGRWL